MKKILLLSKYTRKGASSRLRTMQYISYLEAEGFSIDIQALFDDDYLTCLYAKKQQSKLKLIKLFLYRFKALLSSYKYDVIWVEYEIFPYFPAVFERILKLFNVKYIVDYDDAIFHNYDLSNNPVIKNTLSRKIDVAMKHASLVVCGNEYLMSRARNSGANDVVYIPTVVDYHRYQPIDIVDNSTINIGWIGSPSTQKYIVQLAPVFLELAAKHSIKISLVGASADIHNVFGNLDAEILPWSEELEASYIQSFDIGLMPLVDGPWEKGKCGYKLIQYMACGVPVIASPIGVNTNIVNNNKCGRLAANNEEFYQHLIDLINDSNMRKSMGDYGRKAVVEHYSLQEQAPKLIEMFRSTIQRK
ncbi:glycosyltransferase family 4 protein [Vibrio sp. 10N.261.51.F12]|uniref:glycosyltransferase family 4 protein n=1 Tax=Vibrio sp. 10N.261.51.F12 TaxID=3229679 RepID=UPI00355370A2